MGLLFPSRIYFKACPFRNHLRIVVLAPLAPQFWGEPDLSPPELGDLGG